MTGAIGVKEHTHKKEMQRAIGLTTQNKTEFKCIVVVYKALLN